MTLRRRRALVAVATLGLAMGGPAQAQERKGLARFERDITQSWASFEFQHDFQQLKVDVLREAYNPWVSVFRFEAGPQFFRVAELDLGFGFMTRKGFQLGDDLSRSDERQRMQWFPLSIGVTGRVHIIDEQAVVPFIGVGGDWVFWREDEITVNDTGLVERDEGSRLTGSKSGWHWHVGGNILLDNLAPARAARLEALTGINDTWLTIGYRNQTVGKGSPFDFSGWALTVGVKVDY